MSAYEQRVFEEDDRPAADVTEVELLVETEQLDEHQRTSGGLAPSTVAGIAAEQSLDLTTLGRGREGQPAIVRVGETDQVVDEGDALEVTVVGAQRELEGGRIVHDAAPSPTEIAGSAEPAAQKLELDERSEVIRHEPTFDTEAVMAAYESAKMPEFGKLATAELAAYSMALQELGGWMVGHTMNSQIDFTDDQGRPLDRNWVAKARMTGYLVALRVIQGAGGPELPKFGPDYVKRWEARQYQRPGTVDGDFKRDYGPVDPSVGGSGNRHPAVVKLVDEIFSNSHVRHGAKVMFGIHGGWASMDRPAITLPILETTDKGSRARATLTAGRMDAVQGRSSRH